MDTASYQDQMTAGKAPSHAGQARPTHLEVSVSIRTILLIAGVVALAWALASIANVLLVIFVSFFSVAVLSPVVSPARGRSARIRRSPAIAARAAPMKRATSPASHRRRAERPWPRLMP